MFTTPNVAANHTNITHHTMIRDEKEIALVSIVWQTFLTPSLAGEISDYVKSTLYTRSEALANQQLAAVSFDVSIPPQRITIRMAPDQRDDSFVLAEVKMGAIHVRRVKEKSWRCQFVGTASPASPQQLAQIVECHKKGRFLTFEQVEPDLFYVKK